MAFVETGRPCTRRLGYWSTRRTRQMGQLVGVGSEPAGRRRSPYTTVIAKCAGSEPGTGSFCNASITSRAVDSVACFACSGSGCGVAARTTSARPSQDPARERREEQAAACHEGPAGFGAVSGSAGRSTGESGPRRSGKPTATLTSCQRHGWVARAERDGVAYWTATLNGRVDPARVELAVIRGRHKLPSEVVGRPGDQRASGYPARPRSRGRARPPPGPAPPTAAPHPRTAATPRPAIPPSTATGRPAQPQPRSPAR
jgi:hypothetical protein